MPQLVNAVIIDDEEKDLFAICKSLGKAKIPTTPIHFETASEAYKDCTEAATLNPRVIITDIQMSGTGGIRASKTDISNVARCLIKIIEKTSGPYVVLAWSSTDSFDDLEKYFFEAIESKGLRGPEYFGSIKKEDCQNGGVFCASKIFEDFKRELANKEQINALMHWEKSTLKSANDTVNTLLESSQDEIGVVLHTLGNAVAGDNLSGFESIAINEAFLYILRDKLSQASLEDEAKSVWSKALTPGINLPDSLKHTLNTLLHIDQKPSLDIICPGDVWLCEKENALAERFTTKGHAELLIKNTKTQWVKKNREGALRSQIAECEGKLNKATPTKKEQAKLNLKKKKEELKSYQKKYKKLVEACQLVLLEVSPACDFANQNRALYSMVLGCLIPAGDIGKDFTLSNKASVIHEKIIWDSKEYFFMIDASYVTSLSVGKISGPGLGLKKIFRVRETYLQSWLNKIASNNSRIGTISIK